MAIVASLVTIGLSACGGGGSSSRTIQVDYRSDDFAGSFLGFYPRDVTVKPGTTLKFRQTWNGEPHSVTLGSVIDDGIKPVLDLVRGIQDGTKEDPGEPPPEYNAELFDNTLPGLFNSEQGLQQAAAFPCYIADIKQLPLEHAACATKDQVQPEFTGRLAYYSSGFIRDTGSNANEFDMKIADNAKPGTYFYYCNVHGVLMSGEITVSKTAKVASQAALNREGRAEAQKTAAPLLKVLKKEQAGKGAFPLPLAGSGDKSLQSVEGFVGEFTPRQIQSKVGQKVTWTFVGDHTISFNVPPYTPIFKFTKSGFGFNESLDKAQGGWPGAPVSERNGPDGPDRAPVTLDAGNFDGSGGLKSSGTGFVDGDKYSVTFTKAGTYPYACLIHPGMIGKVVVS